MKPPIDINFWNDRAKQPYCLSIVAAHNQTYVITPLSKGHEIDIVRFKLIEKFHERMLRNEKRF